MIPYQYFYITWVGIFSIIWLALWFWRKDVRKEMLIISFLFGIAGILCEIIYQQDWWKSLTITGTPIGIEDFLIGFFIGGIASIIYEEIYKKKIRPRKKNKSKLSFRNFFLILFVFLFFGSFFILKLNSFYSTIIAVVIPLSIIYVKRKDLIIDSLVSGFLMLVIGISVYFILFILRPGFIQEFWYLRSSWFSNLLLGIPIGEYVWYFLIGAFIGPLYEYWQEKKLVNKK